MQEQSGNNHFIKLLVKWKIYFIIVSVAAVVAGIVLSELIIKPKYRSSALVYPSNITSYGSESPAQQMLQVFKSDDVRIAVTKKLNLSAHYGIDTTEKSGACKLISDYESNVTICMTRLGSVSVKAMDTDPQMACDLANAILVAFNKKVQALQRTKISEQLAVIKRELIIEKRQVDSLNAILEEMRVKYQLFDYEIQSQEVIKAYLNAVSSGKTAGNLKDIDVLMRNLEEKGGEYSEVKRILDAELKNYIDTQAENNVAMKELLKEVTYMNIVTAPASSFKRAYPNTCFMVIVSIITANLFLFLIILLTGNRKNKITTP